MSQVITLAQFREWLLAFAHQIAENEEYLTELDASIGDADHGINMQRGMHKVRERLRDAENQSEDVATLFQLMNPRDLSEMARPQLHRMQLYVASLLAERQAGYLTLRDRSNNRYELDLAVTLSTD